MTKWTKRWAEGQTGWHRDAVNEHLQRHQSVLFEQPAPRILVPLCGRSLDVAWLAGQGAEVVGIDLVEQPLVELFAECGLQPERSTIGGLSALYAESIQLIHSDIFAASSSAIGVFDAIYDRAAMVALPIDLRARYIEHCLSLLRPGGRVLLLTYDSPAADDSGPPYPVRPGGVEQLYAGLAECRLLGSADTFAADEERLRRRNLAWMRTDIWELVK